MPYEVANSLRYNPDFGTDDVKEVIVSLVNSQIDLLPYRDEIWQRTIEIAFARGLTVYDAAYVALAKEIDATFVTANEKLCTRLEGIGYFSHIKDYR